MATASHKKAWAERNRELINRRNRERKPKKACVVCGKMFLGNSTRKSTCSEKCAKIRKKEHQVNYRSKPEYADVKWTSTLKRHYGITPDDYVRMMIEQGGRCAVCRGTHKTSRLLCVDHCHETGKVRGLLCDLCNSAIGKLKDDPERIRAAADYVEAHRG